LKREVESNQRIYETLLQRAKETSLTEHLETSNIRIIHRQRSLRRAIAPQKNQECDLIRFGRLITGSPWHSCLNIWITVFKRRPM